MRRMWRRLVGAECPHAHTVVVTAVGVQRKVCEECGHISFEMTRRTPSARPARTTGLKKVSGL